ncbi:YceI family protein [Roseivirga sp.]|uniref:YceI family protein n=1 Tax=Roseivirga sp. TaxID=1964215 RepID=UPI003B8C4E79
MKLTRIFLALTMLMCTLAVNAQNRYLTRTGHVKFFSTAPMEDIEAHNNKVLSIVDVSKGEVAVDMLMKAFEFEKKLMQEHFNENYMESAKYPKSTFKGSFDSPSGLKEMKDGTYEVDVQGEITIHGVKRPLTTKAILTVKDQKLIGDLVFNVRVKDHEISIPKVVVKNIAEVVEVTASFAYELYK